LAAAPPPPPPPPKRLEKMPFFAALPLAAAGPEDEDEVEDEVEVGTDTDTGVGLRALLMGDTTITVEAEEEASSCWAFICWAACQRTRARYNTLRAVVER
jgi:hypothetical protein